MTEKAEASVYETRRAKRKRDFDLGEAADNATQRARFAGSPKLVSLTDSRQLNGDTCDRLSLPSMPGEIRNHIYRYLLPASPIEVETTGKTKTGRAYGKVSSRFAGIAQVCRSFRYEYVSYVLSRTTFVMDLDMIFGFAGHFSWVLKNSPCKIIADCDARHHAAAVDVLPLLGLMTTAPQLDLAFRADAFGCMDGLDDSETNDLFRLVELSRTHGKWQRHLRDGDVASARIYFPTARCGHGGYITGSPCEARLHVLFNKERRQLWMEGTHNFADLQGFLQETALDGLTSLDVRVGLTTFLNRGRGKGLRTDEEQKAVDWLLRRSKKRPSGVGPTPRMLQELEE